MAITDTTRKVEAAGSTTPTDMVLNSTAAGSLILVAVSSWGSTLPTVSVSDNVNGSYSSAFSIANGTARAALFYFANNGGGNLTISVAHSPAGDTWVAAHEFAGVVTSSPLSGTAATNTGSSLSPSTGSMTPADNDVLLAAVVEHNNHVNTWTINAGSEGFTLSNDWKPGDAGVGQPGSFVFKIISGAPGSVSHSWTISGTTGPWASGIAAFKPVAGPVYTQTKFRLYNDDGTGLGEAA